MQLPLCICLTVTPLSQLAYSAPGSGLQRGCTKLSRLFQSLWSLLKSRKSCYGASFFTEKTSSHLRVVPIGCTIKAKIWNLWNLETFPLLRPGLLQQLPQQFWTQENCLIPWSSIKLFLLKGTNLNRERAYSDRPFFCQIFFQFETDVCFNWKKVNIKLTW